MNHKVLIADDHPMFLVGLKLLLENIGIKEISSVKSCNRVLEELKKEKYTHLILDIGLLDGSVLEILEPIRALYLNVNIMIYSRQPASAYKKAMKQFDINYFLSKVAETEVSRAIILQFLNNEPVQSNIEDDNPFSILSIREMEIVPYIIQGKRPKEIGSLVAVTESTIYTMRQRIFDKLEIENAVQLAELANQYNLT